MCSSGGSGGGRGAGGSFPGNRGSPPARSGTCAGRSAPLPAGEDPPRSSPSTRRGGEGRGLRPRGSPRFPPAAAGRGSPAPLVAVDQEGGRVTRLAAAGFTPFPPARCYSLFCCRASRVAGAVGETMAEELRAVGVDINFAPVLDVDSNPENPVIGDRALSPNPENVAELGIAFFRGTPSRGVLPVGKHFPGHGHTAADSHEELPVVREMKAITGRFGIGAAAVRAVSAGCDIVLVCRGEKDQEEAGEAIARAWADDRDFRKGAAAATRPVSRLRAPLSRAVGGAPPARRGSLRQGGARGHRGLSRLPVARWERSGQAPRAGRSGNIGEG